MSLIGKLGGALGKVVGRVASVGGGLLGGGIGGTIASGLIGRAFGGARPGAGSPIAPKIFTGSGPGLDFGDIGATVRRLVPGGSKGGGRVAMQDGRCPRGYHPAKDGRGCVRNRRMNPANGRAIARSVRRIKMGEKQYRQIFTILHKNAPGKIRPKAKR